MLTKLGESEKTKQAQLPIAQAAFPMPFYEGLEYSSPARGMWNIAHTGMLLPEAHEIFVCALGCLRGVALTAAEMNALGRYSAIEVREENVLQGGMDELMIEGVTDIIGKLPYRPRAILLFISCQHFFLAYEQKPVFAALRERFPDIHFLDCYMIPTLRKSGMTPTVRMQIQMYRMWEKCPAGTEQDGPAVLGSDAGGESDAPGGLDADGTVRKVNLIGSNLATARSSELVRIVEDAGYEFWDLHRCGTFDDYLRMADARLNLVYDPTGRKAAEDVKQRLGMDYLYLTFTYDMEELERNYAMLAKALGIERPDLTEDRARAERAIAHARDVIGETPLVLDYTFTFRILSFARMLLEHGFRVTEIYADAFVPEDEANFVWIREHCPELVISATARPAMRFVHGEEEDDRHVDAKGENPEKDNPQESAKVRVLAVGQKAAYFAGTDHFVNVAESGGYYGYDGIVQVMGLMEDAFLHTKDRKTLIQQKGFGCESCV